MVQLQSFVVEILFSRFWTVHPCSQVDFFCLAANIIQLTVFITLRRVWSCVIPPKLVFIGLCVVQRHFKARSDFNEIWLFHTAEDCFQKVQLIVYWWIESKYTQLNCFELEHSNSHKPKFVHQKQTSNPSKKLELWKYLGKTSTKSEIWTLQTQKLASTQC